MQHLQTFRGEGASCVIQCESRENRVDLNEASAAGVAATAARHGADLAYTVETVGNFGANI